MIIENSSSVIVGDGPVAGIAHLITNNSLQVLDASQLKITNGNNYLFTTAFSPVCIVKLETVGQVSLYPNLVKGHTFFLKTPSNDAVIVKIYTPGGQLLLISPSKGQSQYTIQLPPLTNSYVLVQVIGYGRTQTFTVLAQ